MKVIARKMMYADGTNSAAGFVSPGNGVAVVRSMWYTSPGAGTLKFYPANAMTRAAAAVAASATLTIDTDSNGYVGGAVLTTSDWVLVADDSGTGWQARSISAVGTVASEVVSLTLNTTITCADANPVYVVRDADIVTLTTADETVQGVEYVFNGIGTNPFYAVLAATGACRLSLAIDYEKVP